MIMSFKVLCAWLQSKDMDYIYYVSLLLFFKLVFKDQWTFGKCGRLSHYSNLVNNGKEHMFVYLDCFYNLNSISQHIDD